MSMSARKAKHRIVDMMASTIVMQFRWIAKDAEGARILRFLKSNASRAANELRKAIRNHGSF